MIKVFIVIAALLMGLGAGLLLTSGQYAIGLFALGAAIMLDVIAWPTKSKLP